MNRRLRSLAVSLSLACALLAMPATASAGSLTIKDSSVHASRPSKLDLVGGFGFYGGLLLGAGGWYSMPLLADGFIPALNDAFMLEVGAAVEYTRADAFICDYSYAALVPMGGVRWDFYLNEEWTVFGKAKMGLGYRFAGSSCAGIQVDTSGVAFATDGGVGAYWNLSPGMALRMEFGYPSVNVGLSIDL